MGWIWSKFKKKQVGGKFSLTTVVRIGCQVLMFQRHNWLFTPSCNIVHWLVCYCLYLFSMTHSRAANFAHQNAILCIGQFIFVQFRPTGAWEIEDGPWSGSCVQVASISKQKLHLSVFYIVSFNGFSSSWIFSFFFIWLLVCSHINHIKFLRGDVKRENLLVGSPGICLFAR